MPILNPRDFTRYAMDGSSFIIPNETPCADPHAGCCGGWGLDTPGYPISIMKRLNFTPQPCCINHCRTWQETSGGLPPSDHAPSCPNYELHMFKKITLPGHGSFIDTIENAKIFVESVKGQDDENKYEYSFRHMTKDQFDKLDEFAGF